MRHTLYKDGLLYAIVYSKADAKRIFNREYYNCDYEFNVYAKSNLVMHWSAKGIGHSEAGYDF